MSLHVNGLTRLVYADLIDGRIGEGDRATFTQCIVHVGILLGLRRELIDFRTGEVIDI